LPRGGHPTSHLFVSWRSTQAGRAVAVTTAIFGVTLLALSRLC
jgi:hypothetical protein